jgi:hemolysin activation/secretion protein
MPAAFSHFLPSGSSRRIRLLIGMALWLLPAITLGQAPVTGDNDANAPASSTQYVLQVGAFGDSANAARLSEDLREKGYPTVIKDVENDAGATLAHVFAGPFPDHAAALAAQSALETDGIEGFVRTVTVRAPQPTARQRQAPTNHEQPQDAGAGRSPTNLATDHAQLLAQAQQDMFEVPPVVERPLGMEEGPRVVVSRFELSGAIDREDQDLRVSDLEAVLAGHVSSQPPDGYTINQLQTIADEITRYYRERGFIIAQAVVPAQEVRDGIVNLKVLEGSLQEVRVEGNAIYKASVVEGPFRRLQGQPVVQDSIERALLDVQEFPGLTVFGTFTQGDQVGNTDLVVRVREEDRFYFTPSIDNYGNEFTGEYRAMVDFQVNNLFGVADKTKGYILQTFEPDNGTYGGLSFEFPFGRNSINFGASYNQFDVGGLQELTVLDVEGTVDQAEVFWNRSFANGRYFGANGHLGVALKNAETKAPGIEVGGGDILSEDKLAVAVLDFDFFLASRKGRGFTFGSVGIDIGMPDTFGSMDGSGNEMSSRIGGDGEFAGGSFEKLRFRLEHLRRLSENNSLLIRLDGQYTDDILVSLEQYSIGGPRNVRAYTVAEALADIGASATLEWIINAPGFTDKEAVGGRTWGEIFQVSLYADYAYGELNNPRVTQEPTVDYSGYGLGLQFNVPGSFYARFDVSSPIGSREAINDRDPQYYFRMSYTF